MKQASYDLSYSEYCPLLKKSCPFAEELKIPPKSEFCGDYKSEPCLPGRLA